MKFDGTQISLCGNGVSPQNTSATAFIIRDRNFYLYIDKISRNFIDSVPNIDPIQFVADAK